MSAEVLLLHLSRQVLLQSLLLAWHDPLLPGEDKLYLRHQ